MNSLRPLLRLLPLLLAGCAGNPLTGDPMDQPGTWAPSGDNDANLRAMLADPADLLAGVGTPNSLGVEAAPAVGALLSGKRAPLLDEPTSQLGSGGGSGGNGSPGGGNAGPQ